MRDDTSFRRRAGGLTPVPGFDIHFDSVAGEVPGSDGVDGFPMERGCVGLVVGSVADHGSLAARFTETVLSRLWGLVRGGLGPVEAVTGLNESLHRPREEGRFMTLLLVRLDVAGRSFTCVRAGHNPPLLYRRGTDSFEGVDVPGIALGMMKDVRYVESEPTPIGAGDILLLFTDGLVETTGMDGGQFGEKRAQEVIRRYRDRTCREVCEALLSAADAFHGGEPPEDDRTVLAVRGL